MCVVQNPYDWHDTARVTVTVTIKVIFTCHGMKANVISSINIILLRALILCLLHNEPYWPGQCWADSAQKSTDFILISFMHMRFAFCHHLCSSSLIPQAQTLFFHSCALLNTVHHPFRPCVVWLLIINILREQFSTCPGLLSWKRSSWQQGGFNQSSNIISTFNSRTTCKSAVFSLPAS